jgi:DNA-binding NarL/FixJ family response regulator
MPLDGATMSNASGVVGMRVVLADDSLLVRDGLSRILREQGVTILGHARSAVEAVAEVRRSRPDVVILDVRMPPSYTNEGILAAESIRRDIPSVGILVLAQDAERAHVERLLGSTERGIGYLLKDRVTDWEQLAEALERVAGGGTAVDPLVVEMLLRARTNPSSSKLRDLSDRERTVLALMAEGLTNRGIAERMTVGVRTVESHVQAVFAKLSLKPDDLEHRRVAAVLEYLRARADGA